MLSIDRVSTQKYADGNTGRRAMFAGQRDPSDGSPLNSGRGELFLSEMTPSPH